MATNRFRMRLQQFRELEEGIMSLNLEIRGLVEHFNMIAFNNVKDPHDNLNGQEHANVLALYNALDIYEVRLLLIQLLYDHY